MSSPSHGRLDAGLETLLRVAGRMRPLDPVTLGLASHRRAEARAIASRVRPFVDRLAAPVARREPEAVERFDLLAAYALREMRAAPAPGPRAVLGLLDRLVQPRRGAAPEARAVTNGTRARDLDVLDRFNEHVGSYGRWLSLLEPDLEADLVGPPVCLHELSAGRGGFALAVKARHGARARVVASDVDPGALAAGVDEARQRGLEVEFTRLDPEDLSPLASDRPDILVCTRSLHRFSPGQLARVLAESARSARRAVCFIDAERGAWPIALLGPFLAAYGRSWPVVHDTLASLRRTYVEEELLLLAELAPGKPPAARVKSGRFGPGHAFLRIDLA